MVYFKNSGEQVTARAEVDRVLEFADLNLSKIKYIIKQYGQQIGLRNFDCQKWGQNKKYCILIFLKNPQIVVPSFKINKTGFGIGAAWLVVDDINIIKRDCIKL